MLQVYFESFINPLFLINVRLVGAVSDLKDEMKSLGSAYRFAYGEVSGQKENSALTNFCRISATEE